MRKIKKKIIAMATMTIFIATIITGNIYATDTTFFANITVGNKPVSVEFTITSTNLNEVSLTNGGYASKDVDKFAGDMVIPNEVKDSQGTEYKVTAIGSYAFNGCEKLTSTGLEKNTSIKTVIAMAFYGCEKLTSTGLENNNTVTELIAGAFRNCIQLKSTGLENNTSITSMGDTVFSGCTDLKSTGLENNTSIRSIGPGLFMGCTGLETVVIPKQITNIDVMAFDGCSNLSKVIFRGNVPTYESSSFPSNVQFYTLDGNSSSISSNAYKMKLNIHDDYTKYHVDETYTKEHIQMKIEYIDSSDESVLFTTIPSDKMIENNLLLQDPLILQAGTNRIVGTYDGDSVTFEVNASDHSWEWVIDQAPTTTSTGLKHQECSICHKKLDSQEIAKLPITYTYKVLEGDGSRYTKGTQKDITYKIDGDYNLFTGIKMNGKELSKDVYTSSIGSTVVILKSEYLDTLTSGNYEFTFVFNGNEVKTVLTIKESSSQTTDNPSQDSLIINTPVKNESLSAEKADVINTEDHVSMLVYVEILVSSIIVGCFAFKK